MLPALKLAQMQELGRVINKYLFPILLIAIGIFLLILSSGQNEWYKIGGAGILLVGILGFLFIKGIINRQAQVVVGIVIGIGALFLAFKDYDVIDNRLKNDKLTQRVNSHIIQRLKDIRKAELGYQKENGVYTPSFDTLIDFLKNGELSLIKRLGSLPDSVPTEEMARERGLIHQMPDSLTDEQVIASGMIVRDTIKVNPMQYIFDEEDVADRVGKFYVDSLPYVPFSKHKFVIQTSMIESGGLKQPAILIKDPEPFEQQFTVGSLEKATTAGNWKEQ